MRRFANRQTCLLRRRAVRRARPPLSYITDVSPAEIQNRKRALCDPEAADTPIALFREDDFHFD